MNSNTSQNYRFAVGSTLGFVIGLLGFISLPLFVESPSLWLRTGVLFWYPTVGAVIGMFGQFDVHPVLKFPMPWWFRGALVGIWMNFVLALLAHEQICTLIMALFGHYSAYASPFLMMIEGGLVGLLIDFLLTRWFGDTHSHRSTENNGVMDS